MKKQDNVVLKSEHFAHMHFHYSLIRERVHILDRTIEDNLGDEQQIWIILEGGGITQTQYPITLN